MADGDETKPKRPLRGPADFAEELKSKTPAQVREELDLPNIDQVLKDLQETHGVRIGFSEKMIARAEAAKARGGPDATLASGCSQQDICVLCDHSDICSTCDTMDWCWGSDTHVLEA